LQGLRVVQQAGGHVAGDVGQEIAPETDLAVDVAGHIRGQRIQLGRHHLLQTAAQDLGQHGQAHTQAQQDGDHRDRDQAGDKAVRESAHRRSVRAWWVGVGRDFGEIFAHLLAKGQESPDQTRLPALSQAVQVLDQAGHGVAEG
ncbi:hypothetical protein KXX11_004459, partial [Aspergillus fumigatus]